jgi:hypothetical protein
MDDVQKFAMSTTDSSIFIQIISINTLIKWKIIKEMNTIPYKTTNTQNHNAQNTNQWSWN